MSTGQALGVFPVRTPESLSQHGKSPMWTRMLVSARSNGLKFIEPSTFLLLMHLFYLECLLCFSHPPALPLLNTLVTMETLVWMSESLAQKCFIKSIYRMVWYLSHVWEIIRICHIHDHGQEWVVNTVLYIDLKICVIYTAKTSGFVF